MAFNNRCLIVYQRDSNVYAKSRLQHFIALSNHDWHVIRFRSAEHPMKKIVVTFVVDLKI